MTKTFYTYTIDSLCNTFFGGDCNEYAFRGTNQQEVISRLLNFIKLIPDFNPTEYWISVYSSEIESDDNDHNVYTSVTGSHRIILLSVKLEEWLAEQNTNPDQTKLEV